MNLSSEHDLGRLVTFAGCKAATMISVAFRHQETADTCAVACLAMALGYRFPGGEFSEARLAHRCRCLKGLGCTVKEVYRAACRCKLDPVWLDHARIELEIVDSIAQGSPVLANVQLRLLPYYSSRGQPVQAWHSVLIVGFDAAALYLHDPDPLEGGPERRADRPSFFSGWESELYSAYRL